MLVDRWFHSSPVSDVLRGTPAFPTFSFFWPRNLRFGRLFVANFTNTRRKNLSIKIVPSFSSDTNPLSISIVPFVTKKMAKGTFKMLHLSLHLLLEIIILRFSIVIMRHDLRYNNKFCKCIVQVYTYAYKVVEEWSNLLKS